jgi:hypothetical protein
VPPAKKDAAALGGLRADWIRKVVRDPKEPADALALTGYLAESAKEDHHRLYLDVNLSSYVDIPAEDVVHGQRVQEGSTLAEVIVWVRREARLSYGPTAAQAGGFFDGSIIDQFGGYGGYPGITIPFCPPPTLPPRCFPPPLTPRCPTLPWTGCPITVPPRCPPPPPTPRCPTTPWTGCHRTPVLPCIIHTVIDCPPRTPIVPCFTHDPRCYVRTPVVPCLELTPACPVSAAVVCQTLVCPSAVDACPSAPGGCDTPYNPQNPINPVGFFGGGLGGAFGYGG